MRSMHEHERARDYVETQAPRQRFRVEPPVTRGAPPQTRTSAINASGSSEHAFTESPDITVCAFAICGRCGLQVHGTLRF